jgi:TatD DNase family protein
LVVDTHAHLTDVRLEGETETVLERARAAGVEFVVTVASSLEDSERTVAIAESFDDVYATVGVHPHAADGIDEDVFTRIRELAAHPRVVALGETGLDFHYDNSARAAQRSSFHRHLELAAELDLPVVVHSRSADTETMEIMVGSGWRRGVLHCFSGGPELLEAALGLDWYVSFAGMITFPKYDAADLLRLVPADRLLVETDSPYLSPVPFRGRRNEPARVGLVARRAAELRGEDPGALARATTENARRFYDLAL